MGGVPSTEAAQLVREARCGRSPVQGANTVGMEHVGTGYAPTTDEKGRNVRLRHSYWLALSGSSLDALAWPRGGWGKGDGGGATGREI